MNAGYFVYILANTRGSQPILYVGVTCDLAKRIVEHRRRVRGFTARYNVCELVYAEHWSDVRDAIAREKGIKGWRRARKIALVESRNPGWTDLASTWTDVDSGDGGSFGFASG